MVCLQVSSQSKNVPAESEQDTGRSKESTLIFVPVVSELHGESKLSSWKGLSTESYNKTKTQDSSKEARQK